MTALGRELRRRSRARHPHFNVARARGFDPASTLTAMDIEGVDVAVMYGTRGRQILCHDDLTPDYAAALARAYNNWAADYCKSDPRRLHPMRSQPPRQPEAVAAGFEGKRNPRDLFTGPDCLIAPAMQQAKQPFGTRLQLLERLTLKAGNHTANQPTRLAHLDDGNDRAILVQGDEGPAQVVRLGHQGTPSVRYSDDGAISSPPAPYHLAAGGNGIRTLGPP
jgi:hypothetical protein